MTPDSHIAPSKHSTQEVDDKLEEVEHKIEDAPGAGSPAIKPSELAQDGKAVTNSPRNPNA